jgi:hypothetical protein
MTLAAQRVAWAQDQLHQIGKPVDVNNLVTLVAWATAEGGGFGNVASFDPLNSTQPYNGSHAINSVGVQAYESYTDGLVATAKTLTNGFYPAILAGLASSSTPETMANVIGSEPWGTPAALIAECIPAARSAVAEFHRPAPPAPKPTEDEMHTSHYTQPNGKPGGEYVVQGSRKMPLSLPAEAAAFHAANPEVTEVTMTNAELDTLAAVGWGSL